MRFTRRYGFQFTRELRPVRKLFTLGLSLLVGLVFIWINHQPSNAYSGLTTQTPTSLPASKPLILLWQANIAPDDIVIDAGFIALDDAGNCYVASASGYPIKKFDSNGKFVGTFDAKGAAHDQLSSETGITVDKQGNLYVNDFEKTRVLKFNHDGKLITTWTTEPPVGPTGIGTDSKGNVYVANHRTHEHYIQKFDTNGKLINQWGSEGTGEGQFLGGSRSGPETLAIDIYDNIYVTDPGNHRIQKFDSNGKFLSQLGNTDDNGDPLFRIPGWMAVDTQGNIYVNDTFYLQKFNASGDLIARWEITRGGDLDRLGWIAVDKRGDLYASARGTVTSERGTFNIRILKKFKQP